MKLTKELKEKISAYFENKTSEELEHIFEKYNQNSALDIGEILIDEKYREFFYNSPSFNRALMSIAHGADTYEVIYQVCKTIEEQQKLLERIIRNNISINL